MPSLDASRLSATAKRAVLIVALVQLVNMLDFMMVMPLGPDFAKSLAIDPADIGIIGGSYTAAAAVAGLLGAEFLDRFGRRRALTGAMLGLSLATIAGGLSWNLPWHKMTPVRRVAQRCTFFVGQKCATCCWPSVP